MLTAVTVFDTISTYMNVRLYHHVLRREPKKETNCISRVAKLGRHYLKDVSLKSITGQDGQHSLNQGLIEAFFFAQGRAYAASARMRKSGAARKYPLLTTQCTYAMKAMDSRERRWPETLAPYPQGFT